MSTSLRKPTNPANFTSQEHKFPFTPIDLILDSHSEMKKMKKKNNGATIDTICCPLSRRKLCVVQQRKRH